MTAWCLFEQSGTFKKEFLKLGFENAFDCDILNDFGETDYQIDLFADIEKAFKGENGTIFDKMNAGDLIFAFFPCTKFTEKSFLISQTQGVFFSTYTDLKRLSYTKEHINKVACYYNHLCELVEIALHKDLKLIIENPNTTLHFLKLCFPFKPQITIQNRAQWGGDYYKKPTNFWFFNCEPKKNFIFENIDNAEPKAVEHRESYFIYDSHNNKFCKKMKKLNSKERKENQIQKSMISPKFANRFIREFIL